MIKRAILAFWMVSASVAMAKADAVKNNFIPQQSVTLRVLDKITGHVKVIASRVSKPIHFGALAITIPYCGKSAPDVANDFAAFLVIDEKKPNEEKRLFSGWMFASSPSLSALDHPLTDVWLDHCGAIDTASPLEDKEKISHDAIATDPADD